MSPPPGNTEKEKPAASKTMKPQKAFIPPKSYSKKDAIVIEKIIKSELKGFTKAFFNWYANEGVQIINTALEQGLSPKAAMLIVAHARAEQGLKQHYPVGNHFGIQTNDVRISESKSASTMTTNKPRNMVDFRTGGKLHQVLKEESANKNKTANSMLRRMFRAGDKGIEPGVRGYLLYIQGKTTFNGLTAQEKAFGGTASPTDVMASRKNIASLYALLKSGSAKYLSRLGFYSKKYSDPAKQKELRSFFRAAIKAYKSIATLQRKKYKERIKEIREAIKIIKDAIASLEKNKKENPDYEKEIEKEIKFHKDSIPELRKTIRDLRRRRSNLRKFVKGL